MKARLIVFLVTAIVVGGALVILGQAPDRHSQMDTSLGHRMPVVSSPMEGGTSGTNSPSASSAVPVIPSPTVVPSTIAVNTATIVTITVQITDPLLVPNSVNVLRLNASGTAPVILGEMHDDGLNGDVLAGDGIYTLQAKFTESMAGVISLEISAAFKGLLKRIQSAIVIIPVWNSFQGDGYTFLYPPNLIPQVTSSTRPDELAAYILATDSLDTSVAITSFARSTSSTLLSWYTDTLRGKEYSGSFGATPDNPSESYEIRSCGNSQGLLVKGDLFGNQVSRVFCQANSTIVEFEAAASDGDESPDGIVMQLSNTFDPR